MTSEEKGEMTDWQRVWLERNKNKKVREVVFFSSLHSQWIRTGKIPDDTKDPEAPVDPFEPAGLGIAIDKTKSTFHGKDQKDYLGRSWIVPPSDLHPADQKQSYLPSKVIHKWWES